MRPEIEGHAGFRLNALVSTLANASWGELAAEFIAAKAHPDQLQTFVNTILAEGWREAAEEIDEAALASRRERFGLSASELDQLMDALLVGAKTSAMFAGFLTDLNSTGGLPPDGDLTNANYSSLLARLLSFRARVEQTQYGNLITQFLRPVWRRWIVSEVLSGRLDLTPDLAAEWIMPRPMQVDPQKDLAASGRFPTSRTPRPSAWAKWAAWKNSPSPVRSPTPAAPKAATPCA